MNKIKEYFPLFKNYPNLIYLDNAATTQKPQVMLDGINEYYSHYNSNIGRGVYGLAVLSEKAYSESKKILGDFLGCSANNLAYTSGCTESLNLAAYIATQYIQKKYIILPITEHHANILIWQKISSENNLKIYWVTSKEEILNPYLISQQILKDTAIMALSHVSNVTGEIYPIKLWCQLAKEIGSISIVDGAQGITSTLVNIKDIDCDFYGFSAHKLYGPMGLGVLFMKNKFVQSTPLKLGGSIIENVELDSHSFIEDITKFEAGTPNVANAYCFGKTLQFLQEKNWQGLLQQTHELANYLISELEKINITPLSISEHFEKTHIASFVLPDIHSHDVGTFLAQKNIAVRVGKHCTYPLHNHLKINSSVRASIGIYNTKKDVDTLVEEIKNCIQYFK